MSGESEARHADPARAAADADESQVGAPRPWADEPQVRSDTAIERRSPLVPVILLALAAAGLWAASGMTWVTLVSSDGLTEPRTYRIAGGVWFGALTPLALVLLAGIAAVFATRGWLRRVLGVVVAVLAAVAAVPGFALLSSHGRVALRARVLVDLPLRAQVDEVTVGAFPAALSVFAGALALGAGVLLARMPSSTARMSGKYDNPVFRRAEAAEQVARRARATDPHTIAADAEPVAPQPAPAPQKPLSERVLWDALDAGSDPTDDTAGNEAGHER
jgi:uncharacterized membrane protein (TIGR02234 family)